ncbi:Hypothetical predicted protein [Olea europaea subsp. europaea]|uniref:Dirigent protein n=1 Tax=Olea europaea subsp. europaea TaxID=158383 RepID=A0A8S0SBW0_OLEEU|nr:Hypothetical predicted protein [Olea europaea subsp. europaea]
MGYSPLNNPLKVILDVNLEGMVVVVVVEKDVVILWMFYGIFEVAEAAITANSRTAFGQVRVLDDLITVGPNRSSEALGRAQGLITSADLTVSGIAMNMNFYFTAGKYNGSTLCILGRNPIDENDRELPVVGGTGDFRMARGYSISNTYSYDPVANYGVLEYTVYVAVVEKSGYTAVSMI